MAKKRSKKDFTHGPYLVLAAVLDRRVPVETVADLAYFIGIEVGDTNCTLFTRQQFRNVALNGLGKRILPETVDAIWELTTKCDEFGRQ